jgi:hypothetical protein
VRSGQRNIKFLYKVVTRHKMQTGEETWIAGGARQYHEPLVAVGEAVVLVYTVYSEGIVLQGKIPPSNGCTSHSQEIFGSHFVPTCHSSWIWRVCTPAGDRRRLARHCYCSHVKWDWGYHSGDWIFNVEWSVAPCDRGLSTSQWKVLPPSA